MVSVKIIISEIEYGKSLAEFFTLGMKKCSKMVNPILIGRDMEIDYNGFIKNDTVKQKIGDFAGKAVKNTMFGGSGALWEMVEDVAARGRICCRFSTGTCYRIR